MDPFPIDRLSGSAVRIEGDFNVNHQVRVAAPITLAGGSSTHFQSPASLLQVSTRGSVEAGAQFSGGGTLENGIFSQMTLHDGAVLNNVGLVNHGTLEIGDLTGVATVNRFENSASGTWNVDIGGYLAGVEHDRLLVSGPAGALLDGWLSVNLADLGSGQFQPQLGDQFTILFSFGGVSGTFLDNPISQIGGQLFHWQTIYNPHDVRLQLIDLSSVPEPSAAMLAGLAIGIASWRRRRS